MRPLVKLVPALLIVMIAGPLIPALLASGSSTAGQTWPAAVTGITRGTRTPTAAPKVYVCSPCGLECDSRAFDKPGVCPVCGMTLIEKDSAKAVAILLFGYVQIIDYAGPWEVFGEAGFKVFTVAEKPGPINAVFGQKLVPDYTFENSPKADVLLVPGRGISAAYNNGKLIKWIQHTEKSSRLCNVGLHRGRSCWQRQVCWTFWRRPPVSHSIDSLAKAGGAPKAGEVFARDAHALYA